jgi:hypothetical protein
MSFANYILSSIIIIWMSTCDKWSGSKVLQTFMLLMILNVLGNISSDLRQIDKTLQQICSKEK